MQMHKNRILCMLIVFQRKSKCNALTQAFRWTPHPLKQLQILLPIIASIYSQHFSRNNQWGDTKGL